MTGKKAIMGYRIEAFESALKANDIDLCIEILNSLSEGKRNETIAHLLYILKMTENGNERNSVAYLLGEIQCQDAAKILFDLIFDTKLANNRGTLIFALGKLNCEKYVYDLLPLLWEGNYEVVMNTHILLQDHVHKMLKKDQKKAIYCLQEKINALEEKLEVLVDVRENIFEQRKKEG